MKIVDFTARHVEQAVQIAKRNYSEERKFVPALPPIDKLPDLAPYAENGLGVAAEDGGLFLNEAIIPAILYIFAVSASVFW
jgi:hypothetical protein